MSCPMLNASKKARMGASVIKKLNIFQACIRFKKLNVGKKCREKSLKARMGASVIKN